MNVGIVGTGMYAGTRRHAMETLVDVTLRDGLDALPHVGTRLSSTTEMAVATPFETMLADIDALFVTVPTADHFDIAQAATRQGVHVFLEWPPATSVRECRDMIRLSEEAGVEVGVSRPLRFHPVFETVPTGWRASLILLRQEIPHEDGAVWPRWLADAMDLCCALAQSSSVQRIDAEAVRSTSAWPDAVAFGLRFHSGTYAQISIHRTTGAPANSLYAAGSGLEVEADLTDGRSFPDQGTENAVPAEAYGGEHTLLATETRAFLHALTDQRPVPVSILDGLHTMRLVERLMEKLR